MIEHGINEAHALIRFHKHNQPQCDPLNFHFDPQLLVPPENDGFEGSYDAISEPLPHPLFAFAETPLSEKRATLQLVVFVKTD